MLAAATHQSPPQVRHGARQWRRGFLIGGACRTCSGGLVGPPERRGFSPRRIAPRTAARLASRRRGFPTGHAHMRPRKGRPRPRPAYDYPERRRGVVLRAHVDGHGHGRTAMGQRHRHRLGAALQSAPGVADRGLRSATARDVLQRGEWALTGRASMSRRTATNAARSSSTSISTLRGRSNIAALKQAAMARARFVMASREVNGLTAAPRPLDDQLRPANFAQAGIPAMRWSAGFDDPELHRASCSIRRRRADKGWPGRKPRSATRYGALVGRAETPIQPKWPSCGTAKSCTTESNRRVSPSVSGSSRARSAPGGWRWQTTAVIFLRREKPPTSWRRNACSSRPTTGILATEHSGGRGPCRAKA